MSQGEHFVEPQTQNLGERGQREKMKNLAVLKTEVTMQIPIERNREQTKKNRVELRI
jgi:hypothetical protein